MLSTIGVEGENVAVIWATVKTREGGSAYLFTAPVVPGKEEAWRRFLQEVAESHTEYERLRVQLGVRRESVWLVPIAQGYTTVVYLEVDGDLDGLVRHLAATVEGFDLWFKAGIRECHGRIGAAKLSTGSVFNPIFSWGGGSG